MVQRATPCSFAIIVHPIRIELEQTLLFVRAFLHHIFIISKQFFLVLWRIDLFHHGFQSCDDEG